MYPIQPVPLAQLKGHEANYQRHSPVQIAALVKSLEEFGQVKPIVITGAFVILAGHGIVEAALFLRWNTIMAVLVPSSWDEMKARAYMLADNRLGLLSTVDNMQLAMLLEEQKAAGRNLLSLGSSTDELATLLRKTERGIQIEGLLGHQLERCPECGQLYKPRQPPLVASEERSTSFATKEYNHDTY